MDRRRGKSSKHHAPGSSKSRRGGAGASGGRGGRGGGSTGGAAATTSPSVPIPGAASTSRTRSRPIPIRRTHSTGTTASGPRAVGGRTQGSHVTFAGGLAGGGAGAGAGAGAVMSGRQFGGNDQDVSMLLSQSCPPPAAPIVHSLPAPTGFEMPDLRLPPPSPDALFMSGRPAARLDGVLSAPATNYMAFAGKRSRAAAAAGVMSQSPTILSFMGSSIPEDEPVNIPAPHTSGSHTSSSGKSGLASALGASTLASSSTATTSTTATTATSSALAGSHRGNAASAGAAHHVPRHRLHQIPATASSSTTAPMAVGAGGGAQQQPGGPWGYTATTATATTAAAAATSAGLVASGGDGFRLKHGGSDVDDDEDEVIHMATIHQRLQPKGHGKGSSLFGPSLGDDNAEAELNPAVDGTTSGTAAATRFTLTQAPKAAGATATAAAATTTAGPRAASQLTSQFGQMQVGNGALTAQFAGPTTGAPTMSPDAMLPFGEDEVDDL